MSYLASLETNPYLRDLVMVLAGVDGSTAIALKALCVRLSLGRLRR